MQVYDSSAVHLPLYQWTQAPGKKIETVCDVDMTLSLSLSLSLLRFHPSPSIPSIYSLSPLQYWDTGRGFTMEFTYRAGYAVFATAILSALGLAFYTPSK
jgi:hypothetical protein